MELFAVCEDGLTTVQLTSDDPYDDWQLEVLPAPGSGYQGRLRWSFDDAKVSCSARLWEGNVVVEGGIYSLDVSFAGGTPQPIGLPTLLAAADLVYVGYDGWMPAIRGHDWSPDGAWLVHDHYYSGGPLSIVDLSTGGTWDLLTEGCDPEWSPDGTAIAFVSGGVETINIDGSGRTMVFANTEKPKRGIQPVDYTQTPDMKEIKTVTPEQPEAATTEGAEGKESAGSLTTEKRALASLRPHPRNYRRHPEHQLAILRESLRVHVTLPPRTGPGCMLRCAGGALPPFLYHPE